MKRRSIFIKRLSRDNITLLSLIRFQSEAEYEGTVEEFLEANFR
jgi:hypothetical protein